MRLKVISGLLLSFNVMATTNVAYLSNDASDSFRVQLVKGDDRYLFYNETNVIKFTSEDSYVASRLIGQYKLPLGFNLSSVGTYAPRYKDTLFGLGYSYKGTGVILGVDDKLKEKGLVYWGYRNEEYMLSTNGYLDVTKDPKGRMDIMYNIHNLKFGYEYQYPSKTNWLKVEITL